MDTSHIARISQVVASMVQHGKASCAFDARFGTPPAPGRSHHSDPQTEGIAHLHHVEGYTVLAWWDRSGDTRRNSNAVFLVPGCHPWADALAAAEQAFPRELARMRVRYTIALAGADIEASC